MGKILKILLIIILVIVAIVGIPTIIVYSMIKDSTDDTPIELYDASLNSKTILGNKMSEALDLKEKKKISFTFTEEELNKLIFSQIRDKNNKYLPTKDGKGDMEVENVMSIALPSDIPVIGGKYINVRSIYVEYDKDTLNIIAPAKALGIKTVIRLSITFKESTKDAFILKINNLSLGSFTPNKGIGKKVFDAIKKHGNLSGDSIEQKLNIGLKYDLNLDDFTIKVTKKEIASYLNKKLSPSGTDKTMNDLSDMLLDPDNDIVKIGMIDNKFGLEFDLTKTDNIPESLIVSNDVKTFNELKYMEEVAQGFIISRLSGNSNSKLYISDTAFSGMLYQKSNHYNSFKVSKTIPYSTTPFAFGVEGILIEFTPTELRIRTIININGLQTVVLLIGDIENNDSSNVRIRLKDHITIGEDQSEERKDYIQARSSFIKEIVIQNISALQMMKYIEADDCFEISTESVNEMMTVSGSSSVMVQVNKINIANGRLEISAVVPDTSPILATINAFTSALQNVFKDNDVNSGIFNGATQEEKDNIQTVINNLDNVANNITSGSLTNDDTSNLMNSIMDLSTDNKGKLFTNIANEVSGSMSTLYDSLFGK